MRRAIAVILLATQLAGCATWGPIPAARNAAATPASLPSHIRLRGRAGRWIELFRATQVDDSIYGVLNREFAADTAIAVADVAEIQTTRVSAAANGVGALVGVLVCVGMLALVALGSSGPYIFGQ